MNRPPVTLGLRHLALYSPALEKARDFYVNILGLQIIWQPDADNIYLTSGQDNLALHRAPENFINQAGRLDHFGFFLKSPEDVDAWYAFLVAHQVEIKAKPKDHRDGTRSMYCADPDGNVIQFIYYPLS